MPQAIIDQKAKEEEKKKKKEQLKMLTQGGRTKKAAKPPPPDQFVLQHPYIAPMDMDIIKLTAQFVARNGQKFLIGLTQRESRNPQFDFLKPTHALFGYFTSLVDAYTKCLMPNKDEVEKLKKAVANPSEIMDKATSRFAWDEQEEEKRLNVEEQEKEEKEQMAQIDWHDFVVVETIAFTIEDDGIALAAPIDTSTGAPQGAPVALDSSNPGMLAQEARIEKPKGVEEDEDEEAKVELEKVERDKRDREKEKEREERERRERMEEEDREREERERLEREREEREREEMMPEEDPLEMEPEIPVPAQDAEMKLRRDYVRHKKTTGNRLMQRCPITGQLIPAEEMSNHLKILLLDPKWKHQKDALVERARKESAFADDVEANLAGFVAKRPDLFGSVDEQIREAAEAGAEAAARDAGADAGPAHTMVPPSAQLPNRITPALPGAGGSAGGSTPALPGVGQPGLPGLQSLQLPGVGPIAGVSTINARLPQASLVNTAQAQPAGVLPKAPMPVAPGAIMGSAAADDDDDDEPNAKKPRTEDLTPEAQWVSKHPMPIQILVQVNLGADAAAAGIPTVIPLEISVRTKVSEMKQMLIGRVSAAGVTVQSMQLKAQGAGYILKNDNSLAFYNVAPGNVVELSRKTRGGK